MIKTTDALIHLPGVDAGPWTRFMGRYERRVSFNCKHGNRLYALLKVYTDDEGASMIFVKIYTIVRELSVGEYADPFSIANEILLTLSHECDCHIEMNGEAL